MLKADVERWEVEHITVGQLTAFVAAVRAGSFSAAARRHRRAQSSISLAINNLETDLGVRLFDRSTHTPQLTDAGRLLFEDAQAVVQQIRRMQERAQLIAKCRDIPTCIVTDQLCPPSIIVLALHHYDELFPDMAARLEIRSTPAAIADLLKETDCLALTALAGFDDRRELLRTGTVATVELVPVVAPGHAIARAMPLDLSALNRHRRIELPYTGHGVPGLAEGCVMLVNDLGACLKLLEDGFGWSILPLHSVARKLKSGELLRIAISNAKPEVHLPVELVLHAGRKSSSSLRRLATRILSACEVEKREPRHPDGAREFALAAVKGT